MIPNLDNITAVVLEVGGVPSVGPDEDIYDAGVSSVNALQLLLEFESRFDVTIPDAEFIEARTPRAIQALVERLAGDAA